AGPRNCIGKDPRPLTSEIFIRLLRSEEVTKTTNE
ncbi:hypothetical protein NPIL_60121, partial [Nephila pilipes]